MDINDISMQKFVSQPRDDGYYEVAKWDEVNKEYVPVHKEVYSTEKLAHDRAQLLNEDNKEQKNNHKRKKKMKKTEKQLMDDNSLLPKEDAENEFISPSKKEENNELIPLEKKQMDDPIMSNEIIKRIKQLNDYEYGQLDD